MDSHEYYQKVGYLNRAIGEAKKAKDFFAIEMYVAQRDALKKAWEEEEAARRAKLREQRVQDFLAFAPIVHERAETILTDLPYAREPKKHQTPAAIQLASVGSGILADEPRLGKTFTSHIWMDLLACRRTLIFTPKEVQTTFIDQLRRNRPDISDHRPIVRLGQLTAGQREATLALIGTFTDFIVVSNYESIRRDKKFIKMLADMNFDSMILDESHNVNKTGTATYKGVNAIRFAENWCPRHHDLYSNIYRKTASSKQQCEDCLGLGIENYLTSSIEHVLCMTGSPILNRPQELFSQLHLCFPDEFDQEKNFLYDYCINRGASRWTWRYGGEDRLFEKLGPRIVQRKAHEAGVEIPPQDTVLHEIEFDPTLYPEQARVIEEINKYSAIVLDPDSSEILPITSILAEITRMRQAVVWPAGIGMPCGHCDNCLELPPKSCQNKRRLQVYESHKLDAVEAFLRVASENTRIVVFSQFVPPLKELHRRLGTSSVLYTGATPDYRREQIKQDFMFDRPVGASARTSTGKPKWQILLANSKTGGTGLDLAGADMEVVIDEEWNPGKEDQRDHRIINMDKKTTTQRHIFRQLDSIDYWLLELVNEKRTTIGQFEEARRIIDKLAAKFLGVK